MTTIRTSIIASIMLSAGASSARAFGVTIAAFDDPAFGGASV